MYHFKGDNHSINDLSPVEQESIDEYVYRKNIEKCLCNALPRLLRTAMMVAVAAVVSRSFLVLAAAAAASLSMRGRRRLAMLVATAVLVR